MRFYWTHVICQRFNHKCRHYITRSKTIIYYVWISLGTRKIDNRCTSVIIKHHQISSRVIRHSKYCFVAILNEASPVYIVQECGCIRVWKKFIHVEKNGNFTLHKNNICSVTLNLPLKNCVTHIICHFLEEKFFCAPRRGHFTLSDSVLWRLLLKNHHQILEGYGIFIQNRDPWSC